MSDPRLAFDGLPVLSQVVKDHDLMAKKSLGQNFLFDLNLTCKIARSIPRLDQGTVIEVGPGPGGLTRALLHEGAKSLIALEKDRRCLPALAQVSGHYDGKLQVIEGDAMEQDARTLGPAPRHLASNLPYNIGTVLLTGWLDQIADDPATYASMTLMFQKEVAQRITASAPGDKHYGRLGVLANWLCATEALFDISPEAFVPAPKVTSTVVQLVPREKPLGEVDIKALGRVTQAAFGQRRKMLRQSLKGLGMDATQLCEAAGVEPTARAEEVDILAFGRLAAAL